MVNYIFFLVMLAGPNLAHADAEKGRQLFEEKKCRLCHRIENPGTVFEPACPGLKGVRTRHSVEWIARWLKNPAKVWNEGGPDVDDINKRFFEYRGRKPGPRDSFMATIIGKQVFLTDEEIRHLIDYLQTL